VRVLGIELRRSAAVWICPLLVVTGTVLLYAAVGGWDGRWLRLAVPLRQYLLILIPVVAGAGAWQGRRDRAAAVDELLATTPRPVWQRTTVTAAALAVAAAAGFLGAFVAGVPQVATTATYFSTAWIPMLAVGALALVAAVLLGFGVGRLRPHRLTPSVAAIVSLVALILPQPFTDFDRGPNATLLAPVVDTAFLDDFRTLQPTVHLLQTLELAGLAATGLLLAAASRPVARLLAAVPGVAAIMVAVTLLPSGGMDVGTTPDVAAYVLVCTPDQPTVCVTKVHARALNEVRAPARQALTMLAAKLPGAPTKVVESHTWWTDPDHRPPPPDTVLTYFRVERGGHLPAFDREHLMWDLLDGAGTWPCHRVRPERETRDDAARQAVAAWLMGTPPKWDYNDSLSPALKAYDTLRGLPAAEQEARVAALRRTALACHGRDLLDILVGKGAGS
jgi:hypothetical protein